MTTHAYDGKRSNIPIPKTKRPQTVVTFDIYKEVCKS